MSALLSLRRPPPGRCRRATAVAAVGVVVVVVLAAACADDESSVRGAAGTFRPVTPGVLTVATELPARGFWEGDDPEDVDGGFEHELALALADRFELDRVEIVDVPFEVIVGGGLDGYDLALAQVSITGERARVVDFSSPYLETPVGAVGTPGLSVTDLDAARDRRWGVVGSTTEEDLVARVVRPRGDDTLVYDTVEEALAGVLDGEVDVVALDYLRALAEVSAVEVLALVAELTAPQHYGAVLPAGSDNTEVVDSALRGLRSDGTLRRLERDLHAGFAEDVEQDVPVIRVTV